MNTRHAASSIGFTHARIYETPLLEHTGSLRIEGKTITHVTTTSAAPAPSDHEIDVNGACIVPIMVRSALAAQPASNAHAYDLAIDAPATFAVTRKSVRSAEIAGTLMIPPRDLLALVIDGEVIAWEGRAVVDRAVTNSDEWIGTWVDEARALEQHLLPDGRYSETRNGRRDAYTGNYWTRGDRIAYLDDSGFWAFGVQHDRTLHHASFTMRRR